MKCLGIFFVFFDLWSVGGVFGLFLIVLFVLWYFLVMLVVLVVLMLGVNFFFLLFGVSCIGMLEGSFLKNDVFLVMVCFVFWVVIMFFFLFFILSGLGLNGVDILFCLGCFSNILLLMFSFVFLVWLYLFVYFFIFVFFLVLVCLIFWGVSLCCIWGSVDLSFCLFNNLDGDFFVVLWGVVLYCWSKVNSFCF